MRWHYLSREGKLRLVALLAIVIPILLAGCGQRAGPRARYDIPGADPERGQQSFTEYGCIACHTIPGVTRADSTVDPPLTDWADRTYIAGHFPNNPEYLIRWIMHPQDMDPGNAMPDMGVPEVVARDMAAYLYTLSRGPRLLRTP